MSTNETELRHVALHTLSTVVSRWVFRRAKTVGGQPWPWLHARTFLLPVRFNYKLMDQPEGYTGRDVMIGCQ